MAFLTTGFGADSEPLVFGEGLLLRPLEMRDYSAWARLRAVSRSHLAPWESTWLRNELSQTSFRRRIRHYRREARDDLGYAFGIVDDKSGALMGGITLSNLRRGVCQTASLGYWTGLPYIKKGVMTRAVGLLVPFAMKDLRLHRLEAASMPSNSASIKVLEKNKFEREGFARQLLKINGIWEDHLLFGLISSDGAASEIISE